MHKLTDYQYYSKLTTELWALLKITFAVKTFSMSKKIGRFGWGLL